MTRDDAVARIQQGLGFRDDIPDAIIGALKEARRVLETGRSLPGFLLQESQTLSLPTGGSEIALPTGFIREWQEEPPWYVNPVNPEGVIYPEKVDFNIGRSRFVGADPGKPQAYTLRRDTLKFWPDRDRDYTLTWGYFKHSVDLTTNATNNEWLQDDGGMPEALIGRAGMIVAQDLEDTTSYQKFASMYSIAWAAITSEDQLNDEENRPLIVGSRL